MMMPGQQHERGKLIAQDALRDRLRERYPDRTLMRLPWGWSSYRSGTNDDIQAPDLDELELRLEERFGKERDT